MDSVLVHLSLGDIDQALKRLTDFGFVDVAFVFQQLCAEEQAVVVEMSSTPNPP